MRVCQFRHVGTGVKECDTQLAVQEARLLYRRSRRVSNRLSLFARTNLATVSEKRIANGEDLQLAASVASLALCAPYSFSLLCSVFRLMPRISAARVLLLLVASSVFKMSSRSASSTVVPTPRRTALASCTGARGTTCPKPGGKCLGSTRMPSHTITARSNVL